MKLGQVGSNWMKLDQSGLHWSNWFKLFQIGSSQIKLDHVGSNWMKLDQIGLHWFQSDKVRLRYL